MLFTMKALRAMSDDELFMIEEECPYREDRYHAELVLRERGLVS